MNLQSAPTKTELWLLWYHTMKDGSIVVSILGVRGEVLDGLGRSIWEQFQKDIPQRRMHNRRRPRLRRLGFRRTSTSLPLRLLIIHIPLALTRPTISQLPK
jgi:hypothetical protein